MRQLKQLKSEIKQNKHTYERDEIFPASSWTGEDGRDAQRPEMWFYHICRMTSPSPECTRMHLRRRSDAKNGPPNFLRDAMNRYGIRDICCGGRRIGPTTDVPRRQLVRGQMIARNSASASSEKCSAPFDDVLRSIRLHEAHANTRNSMDINDAYSAAFLCNSLPTDRRDRDVSV